MLYQCNLPHLLHPFRGIYEIYLNSEDIFDPDLPLDKVKAHGGTMVMWHTSLSPYVTVIPSESPSYQSVLIKKPGLLSSIHTVIYLPTAGKEEHFMSSLAELESHFTDLRNSHPGAAHFVRGDANSNPKNAARHNLLMHFCSSFSFKRVPLLHPSYHHFVGDGCFDSEIDVLLYHGPDGVSEHLDQIICKLESPLVNSQHDVILSTCSLPTSPIPPNDDDLVIAPRIANDRIKIVWSEDGIDDYESLVGSSLSEMREQWGNPNSISSISVLLSSTYSCLSFAAKSTNKSIDLGSTHLPKPHCSPDIRSKEKKVLKAREKLELVMADSPTLSAIQDAKQSLRLAKASLRQAVRKESSDFRNKRDEKFSSLISSDPSAAFRLIKSTKAASSSSINNLKVGDKLYTDNKIPDGFYDSLSSLKAPDMSAIHNTSHYQETLMDYENVLKIARHGLKMPPLSPKRSTEILHTLRPNVNDFYSVTASHFINAGYEGLEHFHFLLNTIISDVNFSSLEELNTIWACILHKGHGKDKESHRSYRTISCCPLLAKALDLYAGELYSDGWAEVQAETQFQGAGSSHELAGLLLTEAINFSMFSSKQPVYVLLLDAQSAFDLILRENVIVEAFKAGTCDEGLIYLDNRLGNRQTFCEWSKELVGPIHDRLGVEQGGINSDRLYKLANNNQLKVALHSKLGADMGSMVIPIIGQADDTGLLANSIHELQNLLTLTLEYCEKYSVTLVPEKTKLLAFSPPGCELLTDYAKIISPVNINGTFIPFTDSAEHVGIVRSIHGNRPNILARLAAHRKAFFAVLPAGLAKGHRGNPAASIRAERLYAAPVLLSGLATMVLSVSEIALFAGPFKQHIEKLLRLHQSTPDCVVWFLAGCLPAEALLHLRQMSLFGMISRLRDGNNLLAQHARHMFASAKSSSKSWFLQIQNTFLKYSLPHPITYLDKSPAKDSFKSEIKSAVIKHWEEKFRGQASILDSLKYFRPSFMSLSTTHPMFSTCESSPYEVSKAVVQARYLSGRARVEVLTKHWDLTNKEGFCLLCKDTNPVPGTLEHILLCGGCPALADARLSMISFFNSYMVPRPHLLPLLKACWNTMDSLTMQFLLDCSVIPIIIRATQEYQEPVLKELFYMTRTYAFKIYLTRRRLLQQMGKF